MRKTLSMVALLMLVAISSQAQSFFAPLPKPQKMKVIAGKDKLEAVLDSSVTSTTNAWRPIADIAAYAEPGNILMAGIGGGYQHLTWNVANQRWTTTWSVNAVAFAGGSVVPTTPASVASVGLLGGVDNNLLMLGPTYNFGTKQFGIALSVGINFNN